MESRKTLMPRYTAAVGTNNHEQYFYYATVKACPVAQALVSINGGTLNSSLLKGRERKGRPIDRSKCLCPVVPL